MSGQFRTLAMFFINLPIKSSKLSLQPLHDLSFFLGEKGRTVFAVQLFCHIMPGFPLDPRWQGEEEKKEEEVENLGGENLKEEKEERIVGILRGNFLGVKLEEKILGVKLEENIFRS